MSTKPHIQRWKGSWLIRLPNGVPYPESVRSLREIKEWLLKTYGSLVHYTGTGGCKK